MPRFPENVGIDSEQSDDSGAAITLFSGLVGGGVGGAGTYTGTIATSSIREVAFYVQWTPGAGGGPLSVRFEASPEPAGLTAFHAVPIRSTFTQPATVGSVSAGATPPGQITLAQGQSAFLDVENLQVPRGPILFGQTYTRYVPVAVSGMHQLRLNLFDTGAGPFAGTAVVRYVTVV
jgi:hypothetical protein